MKKLFILLLVITSFSQFGFSTSNEVLYPQDSSMVYDFPEKMAQFPGPPDAMDLFIRKNLVYPANLRAAGVQDKVYVQFVVEKDGSLSNITIRMSSKNVELDQEAINVIKKMPNWIPGSIKGKSVRVKQTIPITFSL